MPCAASFRRFGLALAVAATVAGASPAVAAADDVLTGVVNGAVTVGNSTVETASQAVCTTAAGAGQPAVCAIKIVKYAIATTYIGPNGPVKQLSPPGGAAFGVVVPIDVTNDGVLDVDVKLGPDGASTTKFILEIKKRTPSQSLPLKIEALVNEPTTGNHVINVGYDASSTNAPATWTGKATVTITDPPGDVASDVGVDAAIATTGAPASMAFLGGRYTPGPSGERFQPQSGSLGVSPVPATTKVAFLLEPALARNSAEFSASSVTTATLGLTLADEADTTRVAGKLTGLNKPVKLKVDHVDASGKPTGADGRQRVTLLTDGDVKSANFEYEELEGPDVVSRLRVATGALPKKLFVNQNPTGIAVTALPSIPTVSGGIAVGRRAITGIPSYPRIAVPAEAPRLQSGELAYVSRDRTDGVISTTFRVRDFRRVRVSVDGPANSPVTSVDAELKSEALLVDIRDDGKADGLSLGSPPSRFSVGVNKVPRTVSLKFAPNAVRKVEFCGSAVSTLSPCGAQGQKSPAGIKQLLVFPSFAAAPLFGRATHLKGEIRDIPSKFTLDIAAHVPDATDPNTKIHIDVSAPIGLITLRATDTANGGPPPPKDNGFLYRDRPDEPYYAIAKISGLRGIHVDTAPSLDVELKAEAGHTAEFQLNLPPEEGTPNLEVAGRLEDRPARSRLRLTQPVPINPADPNSALKGELAVRLDSHDEKGKPAVTKRVKVSANGLTDDPKAKIRNITVEATQVPGLVRFEQIPSTDKSVDMKLRTEGGPIGSVFVRATNGVDPEASRKRSFGKKSYVNVIADDTTFFVESKIKQLASFSIKTAPAPPEPPTPPPASYTPQTVVKLDAQATQDLAAHLDLGETDDYQANVFKCPDYDPFGEHNPAHAAIYDVVIEKLPPNLRFTFQETNDGKADYCERETAAQIDYRADGRAKNLTFSTSAGDTAFLYARIGSSESKVLRTPKRFTVCMAGFDKCLRLQGFKVDCSFNYNCDTADADQSIYFDSFGQRTFVVLNYCALNGEASGYTKCNVAGVRKGAFASLALAHLDMAFAYTDGVGFASMNTKSKKVPNHYGVVGKFQWIDHTADDGKGENSGVGLEYATIGFGYDDDSDKPRLHSSQGSKWEHFFQAFLIAPTDSSVDGEVDCVNPGYFGGTALHNTYFKVILEIAGGGNSPSNPGVNATSFICGLQGLH